ncbi:MAG: hypothetical protein JWQ04_2427 [Pedosphaera sp.]|nr:hypothetical protein [Pedosphaera sp.]
MENLLPFMRIMSETHSQRRNRSVQPPWVCHSAWMVSIPNRTAGRLLPWLICSLLLLTGEPLPAQIGLAIGQNFTSSTYGVNSSALPPDANGAIGPRHFMEFINGTVAVYNKTNGVRLQRKTDVKFWSDAGLIISPDSAVTDPRVIYDPASQRWFASMVDFDSTASDPTLEANDFLFAVSATSDPTGTWHGFLFQADPDFGNFADFPTLGLDANAVYLAGDFFQASSPVGPGLVSMPKSDLLAATPTITNRTWFGVMDYAVRGEVLQPAICSDGSSSGNIVAVGDIGMDSSLHSNLVAFAVLDSASPTATLADSTNLTVLPYFVPDNSVEGAPLLTPTQPDGTSALEANDARFAAKVYAVNGVIYAVHNTEYNNRIAIRWYRINAANRHLLESGTIADPNLDLFFPSIAANASGTVVIGCNGTGPGVYISCYAYVGATVNGITTFGGANLLQSGAIDYHGDDEVYADLLGTPPLSRWGDYSATSVDPNDSSRFWTIQIYPSDTDVWSTQITELITTQSLPHLGIVSTGTNMLLSWPSSGGSFQLQQSTNLVSSANWSILSATLVTNGGTVSAVVPVSGNQKFFRLKQGP